jgi:hypothetical protein
LSLRRCAVLALGSLGSLGSLVASLRSRSAILVLLAYRSRKLLALWPRG